MLWLFDLPTMALAGLFALVFVGFTWFGIIFIRPLFRLLFRRQPGLNDLVGYILSSHCAFFGLLLGLLAVAAYQNLVSVEQVVNREAGFLRAIHRSMASYPEPVRSEVQGLIRDYTRFIIEEAWPLQRKGIVTSAGAPMTDEMYAKVFAFEPQTKAQEILHTQTVVQLNQMAELRRARIQAVGTGLPPLMWYVVGAGTMITILLLWMLDMRLIPHLILSGVLVLFLSTVICLVAVTDGPFPGEISIGPEAYLAVYERID